MYENLDSFVRGEHDPDTFYYLIAQSFKNIDNGIYDFVPEEKRFNTNLMLYLDVFRAIMQYIEEFGIYFLAYVDKSADLSTYIVKTNPRDVKSAFQKLIDNDHNEFAVDKGYQNYKDLLMQTFKINAISISIKRKEIYDNLINGIDKIAWFFIYFQELYNAIKHGSRVFPQNYGRFDVFDENKRKLFSINIDESYFEAICKNSATGRLYVNIYPVNLLIHNSLNVLEDVNEIFNFLRKTNDYKKSSPFTYDVVDNIVRYRKVYTDQYSLFLPDSEELENITHDGQIGYARLLVRGTNIYFYLGEKSLEYPFKVEIGPDYGHTPRPGTQSNIKINSSSYMDIEQFSNINKIRELSNLNQNMNVIFFDQDGKKLDKVKYGEIDPPFLQSRYNKDVIEFLVKLKKITGEIIPTPEFMSKKQENLIDSKMNERLSPTDAKAILTDLRLKNNKMDVASFIVKKIDPNGNYLGEIFIGTTENMDHLGFTGYGANLKSKKFSIKSLVDKQLKMKRIFKNPSTFIKEISSSLKNSDDLSSFEIEENYSDQEFGMEVNVKLDEEYWYNSYVVEISIEFREK